jgi:hypothetical protein
MAIYSYTIRPTSSHPEKSEPLNQLSDVEVMAGTIPPGNVEKGLFVTDKELKIIP